MTNDDQERNCPSAMSAIPDQSAHGEREASYGPTADAAADTEQDPTWREFRRLHDFLSTLIADARRAAAPPPADDAPADERLLAEFAAFTERLYAMTPEEMRAVRARHHALRAAARRRLRTVLLADPEGQLGSAPLRNRPGVTVAVADSAPSLIARDRAAAILAALLVNDSEMPPPTPDEEREVAEATERFRSIDRDILIDRAVQMGHAFDLPPTQDARRTIADSIEYHRSMEHAALANRFLRLRRALGVVPSPVEMQGAIRFAESLVTMARMLAPQEPDDAAHDHLRVTPARPHFS